MADFDRKLCAARNRIAARRDGVNASPVLLSRGMPEPYAEQLAASYGKLPKSEDDVMAAINARRVNCDPLTADQVWYGYAEAANSNFIPDRYMFLDASTLRNIARDAEAGFAFMNSHRTGGMSHPTELPFGWSFAGRYEETEGRKRAIIGVYMLRGVKPNGDSGPSTDDLAAMIDAGTVPDVSVGLYGGDAVCDVCGEDVNAMTDSGDWLCPHVPGTTYNVNPSQQKAQKGRGVQDGCASYSLVNARCGETSAVYDGAVPGAGFRKALALSAAMDDACRLQAGRAYVKLARDHDFVPGEPKPLAGQTFADQSESVLAAVDDWLTRAERLQALRAGEGRSLSSERLDDLQRFIDRAQALVTEARRPSKASRLMALRLSLLADEAGIPVSPALAGR